MPSICCLCKSKYSHPLHIFMSWVQEFWTRMSKIMPFLKELFYIQSTAFDVILQTLCKLVSVCIWSWSLLRGFLTLACRKKGATISATWLPLLQIYICFEMSNFTKDSLLTYPSIQLTAAQPIPADLGWRTEHTLYKSPGHHMANTDTDRIRHQQITKPPDPAETDLVINYLYSLF